MPKTRRSRKSTKTIFAPFRIKPKVNQEIQSLQAASPTENSALTEELQVNEKFLSEIACSLQYELLFESINGGIGFLEENRNYHLQLINDATAKHNHQSVRRKLFSDNTVTKDKSTQTCAEVIIHRPSRKALFSDSSVTVDELNLECTQLITHEPITANENDEMNLTNTKKPKKRYIRTTSSSSNYKLRSFNKIKTETEPKNVTIKPNFSSDDSPASVCSSYKTKIKLENGVNKQIIAPKTGITNTKSMSFPSEDRFSAVRNMTLPASVKMEVIVPSNNSQYNLRSSTKTKTESEPTEGTIKPNLYSDDCPASVCSSDKTEIELENGVNKQIIAPKTKITNIKSMSFPSEDRIYAVRKVTLPPSIEMEVIVPSNDSPVVVFNMYNNKNVVVDNIKLNEPREEMGTSTQFECKSKTTENSRTILASKDNSNNKLSKDILLPSNRSPNLNYQLYDNSAQTPTRRRHPMKRILLFDEADTTNQSYKKLIVEEDCNVNIPELVSKDRNIYNSIVNVTNALGGFTASPLITDHTTHLILPSEYRPYKIPKGVPKGCWIMPYVWLSTSHSQQKWLPEEMFALTRLE